MFGSKTAFIIGAGASCEAGLPSGEALKSQIASLLDIRFDYSSQLSGDHSITHALRQAVKLPDGRNGDINPFLRKAWRIRDVVPAIAISIDNFLDAHQGDKEIELCGKLAIVKSILNAEGSSSLQLEREGYDRFKLESMANTWYAGFFQMLTENVPKKNAESIFDNVTIITFNYDRCIERFLVQALSDYYDFPIQDSEKIVRKLSIYHPYGIVGYLPWQNKSPNAPFGSEQADILSISKQIKTFTEGLDDEEMISQMHSAISEAETVVFLGFAFHPNNMKLLTPQGKTKSTRIFATTLGLSKADELVIENDIFTLLNKNDLDFNQKQQIKPEMANVTCKEFFKQYFRSLSAKAQ